MCYVFFEEGMSVVKEIQDISLSNAFGVQFGPDQPIGLVHLTGIYLVLYIKTHPSCFTEQIFSIPVHDQLIFVTPFELQSKNA